MYRLIVLTLILATQFAQSAQAYWLEDGASRGANSKGFITEAKRLTLRGLSKHQIQSLRSSCDGLQRSGRDCPPDVLFGLYNDGFDSFTIEQTPHLRVDVYVSEYEIGYVSGDALSESGLFTTFSSTDGLSSGPGTQSFLPAIGYNTLKAILTVTVPNGCEAPVNPVGLDLHLALARASQGFANPKIEEFYDVVPGPGAYTWKASIFGATHGSDGQSSAIGITPRGFLTASCTGILP